MQSSNRSHSSLSSVSISNQLYYSQTKEAHQVSIALKQLLDCLQINEQKAFLWIELLLLLGQLWLSFLILQSEGQCYYWSNCCLSQQSDGLWYASARLFLITLWSLALIVHKTEDFYILLILKSSMVHVVCLHSGSYRESRFL